MEFKSDNELYEYLEKHAYSAAFSDVLDEQGRRFQVVAPDAGIRPLSNSFVSVGRAVTMINASDGREDEPYERVIECIDSLKPNSLLVTTGNSRFQTGIMGELTATALRARNCRGAVVNGYTRDSRKLISMDFPTFAWGSSPIDTSGRVRVIECNVPVVIGGIKISPGELVFADLDGIVVIPHDIEKETVSEVLDRINTENTVRRELAEGKRMAEVWSKYHVL